MRLEKPERHFDSKCLQLTLLLAKGFDELLVFQRLHFAEFRLFSRAGLGCVLSHETTISFKVICVQVRG